MIEFKNVSKKYPTGAYALSGINLKINKGEFVFIVGHSGAGKSTFLKMILREEIPTEGTVIVNDINTTKMKKRQIPHLRRSLGIVFQDFRLIPSKTVYENVAFALRVIDSSNKSIKKRVPYILSLVGLSHKARCYPSELSGGEQQRVALARALINNPSIIIADEPTGNIDPTMSYEIIELLEEINKVGTTVIIVTHEQELVDKFNKRLITIEKGKIKGDVSHNPKTNVNDAISEIKNYFTNDNILDSKKNNVETELYSDVTSDDIDFVYRKYNKENNGSTDERLMSTMDLMDNLNKKNSEEATVNVGSFVVEQNVEFKISENIVEEPLTKKNDKLVDDRFINIDDETNKKQTSKNINAELLKNNKSIVYDNLDNNDDLFCIESEKENESK